MISLNNVRKIEIEKNTIFSKIIADFLQCTYYLSDYTLVYVSNKKKIKFIKDFSMLVLLVVILLLNVPCLCVFNVFCGRHYHFYTKLISYICKN